MLLRHTLLYLPAQFLAPAMQFVAILVWAQLVSPSDLGIVTLAIAIQEMSFAGFFMWWSHYALRYIKSFKGEEARFQFISSERVALCLSVVFQLLCLLPFLWVYFSEYVTFPRLLVLISFMLSRSLANYVAERARAEAKIVIYSIVQLGVSVGGFLVGLVFMFAFEKNAEAILGGFTVAQAISAGIGFMFNDTGRGRMISSPGVLRRAATFGVPVMLASMLSLVSLNAPRFIVDAVYGMDAVGQFSIGYGLGLRASSFAVMLVTAGAYPLVVRKMETEGLSSAYAQLQTNMLLVGVVVLPVAMGLLALNRSVIGLLVATPYQFATASVLPLATLAGLFRYFRSHTTDQVFLVQARPSIVTWFGVIDLILTVLSSYVGARVYGIAGVAVGPVLAGFVIYLASIWFATQKFGFEFPYSKMIRTVIAAGLMALLVWSRPTAESFPSLALLVVIGIVGYAILLPLLLPTERRLLLSKVFSRSTR